MMRKFAVGMGGALATVVWFAPTVGAESAPGSAPSSSRSAAVTDCGTIPSTFSDQDIDNSGQGDPSVGTQRATVDGLALAGAVDVSYDPIGQDQSNVVRQRLDESSFTGLPALAAGDRFGASIAYADVNGDNCRDLVIGAPGVDQGRGAIVIALGSTSGVASAGAVEVTGLTAGEHFGYAVAAAGRNIWVGAPDRSFDGKSQVGAIDQLRPDESGSFSRFATWTEATPVISGGARRGDRFGRVLRALVPDVPELGWAADSAPETLLVGSPDKDIGSAVNAGRVTVLSFDGTTHRVAATRLIDQGGAHAGVAETGDWFGQAVDGWHGTLVVGVPGENVGHTVNAGIVQTFTGLRSTGGLDSAWTINQDSAGVAGDVTREHRFGYAVSVGQLTFAGCREDLRPQIMIGAPSTVIDGAPAAGQVISIPLEPPVAGVDPLCRIGYQAAYVQAGGWYGAAIAFASTYDADGNPLDPTVAIDSPGGALGFGAYITGVVEYRHDCEDGACIGEVYTTGAKPPDGFRAVLGRSPNG